MDKSHYYSVPQTDKISYDEDLRQYLLQVYNYMTLALAISGLVSLGIAMSPALSAAIWTTNFKWIALLLPVGLSLAFAFLVDKITLQTAKYGLFLFAAAMGLSLSSIFIIFKLGSIIQVFFISAATFGAASIYGYTTKKDLTTLGSFLIMGALGLVIAGVVNLFLQSSAITFVVSLLGVVIFTGLTAYDTQELKNTFDATIGEEREKAGIFGALQLYMDFINIFISLLQLIGEKK